MMLSITIFAALFASSVVLPKEDVGQQELFCIGFLDRAQGYYRTNSPSTYLGMRRAEYLLTMSAKGEAKTLSELQLSVVQKGAASIQHSLMVEDHGEASRIYRDLVLGSANDCVKLALAHAQDLKNE